MSATLFKRYSNTGVSCEYCEISKIASREIFKTAERLSQEHTKYSLVYFHYLFHGKFHSHEKVLVDFREHQERYHY